ncbi:unnamed protein product [Darwinula stevensoni]|uniref:asparaginase n=1 Tax=Darwinula stevensoni TaxID=69355 RepID=A0A7R8XBQ4_9CRUS|nr:unnamed protein product [Darwinula stevensoni]CAG0885063.1 unnamed protein product [Darwinula stevensoni]
MAPFHVHPSMSSLVGLLRLFPSMSLSTVKAFLSPPILGVVLQTYGAGNMPSNRTDILEEIQKASARGVIVLNVTQCPKGGVDAYYATGKVLLDAGVIPGADLTAESALAKLSYVLSKEEWDHATKKKKLQQNLRGELTLFDQDQKPHEQADLLAALGKALHVSSSKELDQVKEFLFPCVLCAAAKTGDISKIKNLIKHGADVSSMDYDSRTALHIACSEGNTKVARYLLSKGASVHVRDRNDRTPLMDAIKYGHVECVQVLVQCGACLNPNNADLATLVSRAVADENMKVLEAFKLAGADFNVHDPGKRTPLHLAVFLGKKEVVQFLLAAGASTATLDDLNMTPVQIAKRHERRDLVELLSHFDFKTELPRLEAVAAGAAEH